MTGKEEANDVLEYPYFGIRGPGSSVGIAIDYGLDGPVSRFSARPDRPWGPPSLL